MIAAKINRMSGTLLRSVASGPYYKRRRASAALNDKAITRARKIIAAFMKNTTGLFVVDGELIELPVVRSMYRVLAIADRIAKNRQPG